MTTTTSLQRRLSVHPSPAWAMALLLSLPVGISLGSMAPAQAQLGSEQAVPSTPQMPGTPAPSDGSSPTAAPALPILDDAYTLGAGDRIHLDFFNIPEYTGETQVLADGSLNLPLVGNISVQGQTLNGAADTIEAAYQQLLRNPIVTISLLRPRPLRVSIAGEVNRPGSYAMSLRAEDGEATEFQWPTVTQVIQTAGGITQQADVSQIQIQRADKSGEAERITVNLWDLLKEADLSQDRPLRDGDSIVIPTATSIQAAEATQLSSASFAPDTIRVSIVGEVVAPGVVEVPPNTPLNQALLAAGGFDRSRARTSRVELIRLNPDGTATQQSIPIDFAQGISDNSNPILRNNDVVVVGRSDSAQFSDSVNGILETIGRIFPFFSLF